MARWSNLRGLAVRVFPATGVLTLAVLVQLTLRQPLSGRNSPLELHRHTGFLNEPLYSGHASRLSDETASRRR